MPDKLMTMREAIATYVEDGMTVALEGFSHLIPFAAAHEIIRQGRRDLTLCRMTPDIISDQLIAADCVSKLVASFFASGSAGSLYEIRRRIESHDPVALEVEEYSHYGMVCRYQPARPGCPSSRCARMRQRPAEDQPEHPARRGSLQRRQRLRCASAEPGRDDHPRAARRPLRQRPDLGHRRCAAGSGLRCEEGHRGGRGDRRRRRDPLRSQPHPRPFARGGRGGAEPARSAPLLRAGLLRPRLRVLPPMDRDQQGPPATAHLVEGMVLTTADHAEYLEKLGEEYWADLEVAPRPSGTVDYGSRK